VALQKCQSGDSVCPLECNDWALDSDCGGVPGVHNFVFPDDPSVLLGDPWSDPTIRAYPPLVDKVAEVTGGLTLEYDKAYALAAWVKGKADYDLTFQCPETIADLMGIDKGYCEQSAHLLSYALRTAGIPAAVSVQGGHSLTVANVDGQWVDFDATFGEGVPGVTDPGLVGNVVDQASWHLPADVFLQPFAAPYIFREPQVYMPKTRRVPLVKEGGAQAGWGPVLIPVTNQRLTAPFRSSTMRRSRTACITSSPGCAPSTGFRRATGRRTCRATGTTWCPRSTASCARRTTCPAIPTP
jgi:hypothetical protein